MVGPRDARDCPELRPFKFGKRVKVEVVNGKANVILSGEVKGEKVALVFSFKGVVLQVHTLQHNIQPKRRT